jgi:hypothetical protein
VVPAAGGGARHLLLLFEQTASTQKADAYSGCRSSRDLEAFAKRHRDLLNQMLGMNFKRWPSDATFLYLYRCAEA